VRSGAFCCDRHCHFGVFGSGGNISRQKQIMRIQYPGSLAGVRFRSDRVVFDSPKGSSINVLCPPVEISGEGESR